MTPEDPLRHVLELAGLPGLPEPDAAALAGRRLLAVNGTPGARESVRSAAARHGAVATAWDDDRESAPGDDEIPDIIVDLGVPAGVPVRPGAWRAPMSRTVEVLRWVYPVWARETRAGRLQYVAVTAMGGSMGLLPDPAAQPLGGLWAGLAKTLPREFPVCRPLVLDLPADGDPGAVVVAEIVASRLFEVGRPDGRRVTLMPRECPVGGGPVPLGSGDVLLFTGGARGIGFEIALEMAASYGCEVVVTGRSPLPAPDTVWLTASAEEQAAMERDLYTRRGDAPVVQVRRRIATMRQAREIRQNLDRARRRGLSVGYRTCDVTSARDVADLVRDLGPRLSAVVHNAGIDQPKRLPSKSTAEFLEVIAVKADGFLNLLTALGDHRLKVLCAVGSQTGRYGGMPGQLDYAAANDGLARLAYWAGHRLGYPVKTLAWPTWEGVGLITNLKAATRYMRPITVAAGTRAWRAELTHDDRGEIGYMAEIGEVAPVYLHGIPLPPHWAGRDRMLTRRFLLGDVTEFAPGRLLESRHRLHADWATCLHDVSVDGAPAMPVSLALELLYAVRLWLGPPAEEPPAYTRLRDVAIRPAALRLAADDTVTLVRHARAEWRGTDWVADVELWHSGIRAATGSVVLTDDPGPARGGEPGEDGPPAPRAGYRWAPTAADPADWSRTVDGWARPVIPASPLDLFTLHEPPTPDLPVSHLEAAVQHAPGAGGADPVWTLAEGRFTTGTAARLRTVPHRGLALITDDRGRTVAELIGSRWRPAEDHRSPISEEES
ncbi:KR domain-containing protein [Actinoplanes sp. NPDC051851]|uniref:KR domain-containing protein n=1 Tax=Actinoplanes sp. NPDC051851 TaxID=3154753 RepID=UPI00344AB624